MRLVRRMTAARIVAALTAGSVLACQGGKPSAGAAVAREASVAPSGTLGARIVCDPSYVPHAGLFVFKIAQ
jgi:hypothetical protein